MEDARLIGSTSYIYEAGCAVVIDGERTVLDRRSRAPTRAGPLAETMVDRGIPDELFEHFAGRLEWHSPWHRERELSLLFRGKVDVDEANGCSPSDGHDGLRLIDNGAIVAPMDGDRRAGPRLPPGPGGGQQGERRRLPHARPRLRARGVHRDRRLGRGPRRRRGRSAASSSPPTARSATRACARRSPAGPTSRSPRARMGDGVYEAVVSTLMERR